MAKMKCPLGHVMSRMYIRSDREGQPKWKKSEYWFCPDCKVFDQVIHENELKEYYGRGI